MTLKEIAAQAGVSVSTVSRVINQKGSKSASKEIQDRIWEIVRSSGYTPNHMAQSLKLGSHVAGRSLSIACLFARSVNSYSDPFFSSLARRIEETAIQMGHVVKYTFSSVDFQDQSILNTIKDNNVSGVIILGRCDPQLLKLLKQYFGYVAYTGLNRLNADYDQIICDGKEASKVAVSYLIGLGHTKIGYFGEMQNEDRYIGYRTALIEHGLPINPDYAFNVILSSEGGYKGADQLLALEDRPSAIFCANDVTAIGVIRKLNEHGVRVPEDVSVISIDDLETSKYMSPALTTIKIPVEEMGPAATKVLIDRINGGHKLPCKMYLPFKLIERESCCPSRQK